MRTKLFQAIADVFPTALIGQNHFLQAVWRVLFYTIRPRHPFVMRLPLYRARVSPSKGSLTRALIRRGYWEPLETEIFLSHVGEADVVIDIGANFGHFALAAAAVAGPNGLAVAFEPHPEAFAELQANQGLNPTLKVRAVRAALSDTAGKADLITDRANPGGHSMSASNVVAPGEVVSVATWRLDDWLSDNLNGRRVAAIKIDAQGMEARVLRGATRTIRDDRPVVLCEVTPDMSAALGESVDDIFALFADAGFGVFVIEGSGDLRPVAYDGVAEILDSLPAGAYRNFLFIPDETGVDSPVVRGASVT